MTLPTITDKQQEVLLLLYRFRFLNRKHIQSLLHHKTFNRVNQWLRDLTNKNYIGKIENPSNTITTTPAIYHIAGNGIKYLKKQSVCQRIYIQRMYADHKRKIEFIQRSLFIADIYLSLYEKHAANRGFELYTQSDYSVDGMIKEIFPHFVYRKREGDMLNIAEIFGGTMPRYAIRSRIVRYLTFFTNKEWTQLEQIPNLLFICPSEELEKYIYSKVGKYMAEEDIEAPVYVTTEDQVRKNSINADIWKKVEISD